MHRFQNRAALNVLHSLTLCLTLFVADQSVASDFKTYPASLCQPGTSDVKLDSSGRMYNTSTSVRSIYCPLVRDIHDSTSWASAYVSVRDTHPPSSVTCLLSHYTDDGGAYYTSSYVKVSSGDSYYGSSFKRLSFSAGTATVSTGYLFLKCDLPAAYNGQYSYVSDYQIAEGQ